MHGRDNTMRRRGDERVQRGTEAAVGRGVDGGSQALAGRRRGVAVSGGPQPKTERDGRRGSTGPTPEVKMGRVQWEAKKCVGYRGGVKGACGRRQVHEGGSGGGGGVEDPTWALFSIGGAFQLKIK